MAASRPEFGARLAVAEERLSGQGAEIQRLRERMHIVEGDRAAIRLAVGALDQLRRDMPDLARTVAKETVSLALEERDEHNREERQERRAGWGFAFQCLGALIGAAGFLYGLIAFLHSVH